MPKKNYIPTPLAPMKYDRCIDCPLCGLIPKDERKQGKRMKYVCLGVNLKPLTSKGVWIKASNRDAKHPLKRPCDNYWDAWMATLKRREFNLGFIYYTKYRLPFEQSVQLRINFD